MLFCFTLTSARRDGTDIRHQTEARSAASGVSNRLNQFLMCVFAIVLRSGYLRVLGHFPFTYRSVDGFKALRRFPRTRSCSMIGTASPALRDGFRRPHEQTLRAVHFESITCTYAFFL